MVKLLYTKFEYFKKKHDEILSKYEDLEMKYKTESEMKKYLLGKVRDLEGMQINISTEIIQYKKEIIVFFK